MANDTETQEQNRILTSNAQAINNQPFMLKRIETEPLIEKIQLFLSSQKVEVTFDEKTQDWKQKVVTVGLPLANVEGIMRICNIVEMRVNSQTVQGNFEGDHYWDHISRARKEITETIVKKCYDWDVHDSNLNMIIDEICALIEVFLTRPINNKERDGYANSFVGKENTLIQQPRSAFQGFAGGMGGNRQ